MKMSTNRYNIMLEKNGKRSLESFYGYTSRKVAEERAVAWRNAGFKATVTDKEEK